MNLVFKDYRFLSKEEHLDILQIRNSNYVRQNMMNKNIIEIKSHLEWVDNLKTDNNVYFAVFLEDKIIGAVYITDVDHIEKKSMWGLFFEERINPMVSTLSTYILLEYIYNDLTLEDLYLEVNKKNINAYKFDLNFGFKVYAECKNEDDEFYKMHMCKSDWITKKESALLGIIYKKLQKVEYRFIERK